MTAALVSNTERDENGERLPMSVERAETLANIPQFAESLERLLLRDKRDGQLWERVAERTRPDYDIYPWGCLNAVEHFHPERVNAGPNYAQSVALLGHAMPFAGIIRAGERIK